MDRTEKNRRGGTVIKTFNVEVPEAGAIFPQANSKCDNDVSKEEVALATRMYFQIHHPSLLLEKVES